MRSETGHGGVPRRSPASSSPTAPDQPLTVPMQTEETTPQLERLRVALQVEIPSDVMYIEPVVEMVREQCERLGFGPRQVMLNLPVALSEALSNAVLRGNGQREGTSVRVRATFDARGLTLDVADQGKGFDMAQCCVDPTTEENLEKENGRGLFLMRSLMDSVERFDDPERPGSVVRLQLARA